MGPAAGVGTPQSIKGPHKATHGQGQRGLLTHSSLALTKYTQQSDADAEAEAWLVGAVAWRGAVNNLSHLE